MNRSLAVLALALTHCSSPPSAPPGPSSVAVATGSPPPAGGVSAPIGTVGSPSTQPMPSAAPPPPAAAPTLPPKPAGDDFAAQAQLLFRAAACGGDEPLPPQLPARLIERHCEGMRRRYASYRRAWADKAGPFIAQLRPADIPTTVVYPFGGGDLVSALVVFPDATEVTTVSLEAAGDVRVIDEVKSTQLGNDLEVIGHNIGRLFHAAHSTTKSLQAASHSRLPGTLMFALAALAVHDQVPVSLRYFDIEPDGQLRYLTGAELDQRVRLALAEPSPKPATRERRKGQVDHPWHKQESVFANVEIEFRPRARPDAAVRRYRHIVANLDDDHLGADRRVLAHLEAKGKVAVMTKAASFLLWYDDFQQIRSYLISHLTWMISDASGIPPSYAQAAGLRQTTFGRFVGPYFIKDPANVRRSFVELWRRNPSRPLPFRFGYPDSEKHHHMMITEPASR